jgi:DNA topoisomerase-2
MDQALCREYQKKTDKQHVLDNPEPYTRAMETTPYDTFVWDERTGSFQAKELQIIPGLYKLFDEAVVNARDHYVRQAEAYQSDPSVNVVTKIDFAIDDAGLITVRNDGDGIDVTENPEHKVFIPELIFGHLRTSTNYDKREKRTGGGRNGLGFKLALIWSSHGSVETVDSTRGLKYYQTFDSNLSEISKPKITKARCKPYTQVSCIADLSCAFLEASYCVGRQRNKTSVAVMSSNVPIFLKRS